MRHNVQNIAHKPGQKQHCFSQIGNKSTPKKKRKIGINTDDPVAGAATSAASAAASDEPIEKRWYNPKQQKQQLKQ